MRVKTGSLPFRENFGVFPYIFPYRSEQVLQSGQWYSNIIGAINAPFVEYIALYGTFAPTITTGPALQVPPRAPKKDIHSDVLFYFCSKTAPAYPEKADPGHPALPQ